MSPCRAAGRNSLAENHLPALPLRLRESRMIPVLESGKGLSMQEHELLHSPKNRKAWMHGLFELFTVVHVGVNALVLRCPTSHQM